MFGLSKKQTLFDRAEAAKQQGMKASYDHADTDWKKAAAKRINWLAEHRREFTADDVMEYLDAKGIFTSDSRALGGVMGTANREGLVAPTDKFRQSRRLSRHRAPIRIWESNVFGRNAQ